MSEGLPVRDLEGAINNIADFLAVRDIKYLDRECIYQKYGITQVDIIILLGNSMPITAELTANALKEGLAKKILISGGIGHSTQFLYDNIKKNPVYSGISTEGRSEAEILKDIMIKNLNVEEEAIILETNSTNCGSNAEEALKVLKEHNINPKFILIIQDPTMQLRSWASFSKVWEDQEKCTFINYAPFIPEILIQDGQLRYVNDNLPGLWEEQRFLSLILGEIPRLSDNEEGYGPKGKGFIVHVDIPDEVITSYELAKRYFNKYLQMRITDK